MFMSRGLSHDLGLGRCPALVARHSPGLWCPPLIWAGGAPSMLSSPSYNYQGRLGIWSLHLDSHFTVSSVVATCAGAPVLIMTAQQPGDERRYQHLAPSTTSYPHFSDSSDPGPFHADGGSKSVRVKFEASRRSAIQNLRAYLDDQHVK
jgi:hypothetical protein